MFEVVKDYKEIMKYIFKEAKDEVREAETFIGGIFALLGGLLTLTAFIIIGLAVLIAIGTLIYYGILYYQFAIPTIAFITLTTWYLRKNV